jgi:hypothetical protein
MKNLLMRDSEKIKLISNLESCFCFLTKTNTLQTSPLQKSNTHEGNNDTLKLNETLKNLPLQE